jgi:hypothetical protein
MSKDAGNPPKNLEGFRRQQCTVCGCEEKFNFHVPDDVWKKVLPSQYQNTVVCLSCFDNFAHEKNISYSRSVIDLLFAGNKAALEFEPKSARDV